MSEGFTTLIRRQRDNPCCWNISPNLLQGRTRSFHLQEKWRPQLFEMQMTFCFSIFKRSIPSRESTISTCRYSNGGLSRSDAQEIWRKRFSFIRAMFKHISPWFQWPFYETVAFKWLYTILILLIWPHLTICVLQQEKIVDWKPVSQWWCLYICC